MLQSAQETVASPTLPPPPQSWLDVADDNLTSLQVARGIQKHLDLNDRSAVAASAVEPDADTLGGASFDRGLEERGAAQHLQAEDCRVNNEREDGPARGISRWRATAEGEAHKPRNLLPIFCQLIGGHVAIRGTGF
ncbi:unnamed protein product [Lampetra fluviatilis]